MFYKNSTKLSFTIYITAPLTYVETILISDYFKLLRAVFIKKADKRSHYFPIPLDCTYIHNTTKTTKRLFLRSYPSARASHGVFATWGVFCGSKSNKKSRRNRQDFFKAYARNVTNIEMNARCKKFLRPRRTHSTTRGAKISSNEAVAQYFNV